MNLQQKIKEGGKVLNPIFWLNEPAMGGYFNVFNALKIATYTGIYLIAKKALKKGKRR